MSVIDFNIQFILIALLSFDQYVKLTQYTISFTVAQKIKLLKDFLMFQIVLETSVCYTLFANV